MTFKILITVAIIYALNKFYSWVFKKAPKTLFVLDDYAKPDASGINRLLSPIATCFAFIGNFIHELVWFLSELYAWAVEGIKWVYNEVFKGFIFILLRVLWHYFIVWPWSILMLVFRELKPSLNFKLFYYAARGIFFTLVIYHFGNSLFETSYLIQHIIPYLSMVPVGLACSRIIYSIKHQDSFKWYSSSYLKHSILIVFILGLVYFIETRIILLGTYGSYSAFFSALFAGTALFNSALMVFNAILCLFILNALPSFSNEHSTIKNRTLYRNFGLHILKHGLTYLLALPILILPFVAINYIPYKISHSLALPSKYMTDKTFSSKIKTLTEEKAALDSVLKKSKNNLYNFKKINDDSLNKLFKLETSLQKKEIQLLNAVHLKDELYSFYSNFEDSVGAAPLAILLKLKNKSESFVESEKNKVPKIQSIVLDSAVYNPRIAQQQKSILQDSINLRNAEIEIKNTNYELSWKNCVEPNKPVKNEVEKNEVEKNEAEKNEVTCDTCECINQKAKLKKDLLLYTYQRDSITLQKARNILISQHLAQLKTSRIAAFKNSKRSSVLGRTALILWYFIILSISLALGLVLFARVNHALYNLSHDGSPYFVASEFNAAKSLNPKQPFLGMGISLFAFIYLSVSTTTWYYNPKQIVKKAWGEMGKIKTEVLNSHYFNPTHWNKKWAVDYWTGFKNAGTIQKPVKDTTAAAADTLTTANKATNKDANSGSYNVIAEKAYFYSEPSEDKKQKAYLISGQSGTYTQLSNGFLFTTFYNEEGASTSGWILIKDVEGVLE